jgi:hypothetical protein
MKSRIFCALACVAAITFTATVNCAPAAPPPKQDAPAPSVYAMAKAFEQGDAIVPISQWTGKNDLQKEFIQSFINRAKSANKLPKGMLEAIGSDDAAKINAFLRNHGLSMQLGAFPADTFGMAAVLSVSGKWAAADAPLTGLDKKSYSGVVLRINEFYQVAGHADPVVRIYHDPSTDVSVYVTPWDGEDAGFTAVRAARKLTPNATTSKHQRNYSILHMPMIDMDRTVELDWLAGMTGGRYRVTRALAQTKLQLDEHGFSVKQGFAAAASAGPPPPTYILNKPFLLWVQVGKLAYPVFSTKVETQYWKDPKAGGTSNNSGDDDAEEDDDSELQGSSTRIWCPSPDCSTSNLPPCRTWRKSCAMPVWTKVF